MDLPGQRRRTRADSRAAFGLVHGESMCLIEQFPDVVTKSLICRAVPFIVNEMFQIVEQFMRVRVTLVKRAGKSALQDLVQSIINSWIDLAKVRDGQGQDPLARLLGGLAFKNIVAEQ